MLRGCTEYKGPQDFYATAVCRDPETGQSSEQLISGDWERVEDGADRCAPCRQVVRNPPTLPRGDEENAGTGASGDPADAQPGAAQQQ